LQIQLPELKILLDVVSQVKHWVAEEPEQVKQRGLQVPHSSVTADTS